MEGTHSPESISHSVSLRRASPEDLNFLFTVSTEAMRPVIETLNPDKVFNREEELKKYKEKFKPEDIEVIQYGGQDVGRLRVVRSNESIYVGGIQILPEYQRQGIGSAIFSDLISESEQTGLPIILEVHDVNEQARSFYQKLGFQEGEQVNDQKIMKYIPKHS